MENNCIKGVDESLAKANSRSEVMCIIQVGCLFVDKSKDYILQDLLKKHGKENLQINNMR